MHVPQRLPWVLSAVIVAVSTVAGCGGESRPASAATPDAASTKTVDAEACPRWFESVQGLCTDYVAGRAVDANCPHHAAMVLNSVPMMADQPDGVRATVCARHLQTLQAQRAEGSARSGAVDYAPVCRELAAKVQANCVDALASGADAMQCQGQFNGIATARANTGEQQALVCGINLQMLQH